MNVLTNYCYTQRRFNGLLREIIVGTLSAIAVVLDDSAIA